jgi:ankyrin repeat protein
MLESRELAECVRQRQWERVQQEICVYEAKQLNSVRPCGSALLCLMAAECPFELIQLALTKGADPNIKENSNASQRTPLWFAAQRGREDVVDLLINHGAICRKVSGIFSFRDGIPSELEVEIEKDYHHWRFQQLAKLSPTDELDDCWALGEKFSPLYWAVRRGSTRMVKSLVQRAKGNVNEQGVNKHSLLWVAALAGHPEMIRLLLELGFDKHRNKDTIEALFVASNVETLKVLIEEVNIAHPQETLMWIPTVCLHHIDMYQRRDLLETRSPTEIQNDIRDIFEYQLNSDIIRTSLTHENPSEADDYIQVHNAYWFSFIQNIEEVDYMEKFIALAGVNVNYADKIGDTAVRSACTSANFEKLTKLHFLGAKFDAVISHDGSTDYLGTLNHANLIHACLHNQSDKFDKRKKCVKYLMEHGCHPLWRASTGMTGLYLAAVMELNDLVVDILEFLRKENLYFDLTHLEEGIDPPVEVKLFDVDDETREEFVHLPLMCIFSGTANWKATELLLSIGANVKEYGPRDESTDYFAANTSFLTALHYAFAQTLFIHPHAYRNPIEQQPCPIAFENVLKTVTLLLDHNADPFAEDSKRNTPLHRLGSDILQPSQRSITNNLPHGVLVNKLIDVVGPEILNKQNANGDTPLSFALRRTSLFAALALVPDELDETTTLLCTNRSKLTITDENSLRACICNMSEAYKATLVSIGVLNKHFIGKKRAPYRNGE